MQGVCRECGSPYTGKASQKFCSKSCGNRFRLKQVALEGCCSVCHRSYTLTRSMVEDRTRKGVAAGDLSMCGDCGVSGENNPNWKGGHRHWTPGRFGKDKNGLSWKVQRRLAWERDKFTCQHCGEQKNRKPDVHHIEPWMNSQSHALDNLICLCQSCHLKEEAKVQEKWGGQLFMASRKPKKVKVTKPPRAKVTKAPTPTTPLWRCGCGVTRFYPSPCKVCERRQRNKEEASALRSSGLLPNQISQKMGVSIRTVHYWLKNISGSAPPHGGVVS